MFKLLPHVMAIVFNNIKNIFKWIQMRVSKKNGKWDRKGETHVG